MWLAKQENLAPKGMIVMQATGYKVAKTGKQPDTDFSACFVPAPDETGEQRWLLQVEKALDALAHDTINPPGPCHAWFRECPHKTSGECEGV